MSHSWLLQATERVARTTFCLFQVICLTEGRLLSSWAASLERETLERTGALPSSHLWSTCPYVLRPGCPPALSAAAFMFTVFHTGLLLKFLFDLKKGVASPFSWCRALPSQALQKGGRGRDRLCKLRPRWGWGRAGAELGPEDGPALS